MTWVRKQAAQQEHTCQPPMCRPPGLAGWGTLRGVPDGGVSDLWRCDTCRKLWRITKLSGGANVPLNRRWRPATWWQRLTHPDHGTRPSRGGGYPAPEVSSDRLPRVPPGPGPGSGQRLAPGARWRQPQPDRPTMPPPDAGTALDPTGAASVPPPTTTVPSPPPPSSGRST